MLLVQVQYFETGTRYDREILHKCGKKVETESQKILRCNPFICRSYSGKIGREAFLPGAEYIQNFYKGEI